MARIAIIGGGSMGEALLSGMLRAGRQVKDLVVAEKYPDRAKYLAEKYSVLVTNVGDAVDTATSIWNRINLVNLHENILPTRQRADLILTKEESHAVEQVALRKL